MARIMRVARSLDHVHTSRSLKLGGRKKPQFKLGEAAATNGAL